MKFTYLGSQVYPGIGELAKWLLTWQLCKSLFKLVIHLGNPSFHKIVASLPGLQTFPFVSKIVSHRPILIKRHANSCANGRNWMKCTRGCKIYAWLALKRLAYGNKKTRIFVGWPFLLFDYKFKNICFMNRLLPYSKDCKSELCLWLVG